MSVWFHIFKTKATVILLSVAAWTEDKSHCHPVYVSVAAWTEDKSHRELIYTKQHYKSYHRWKNLKTHHKIFFVALIVSCLHTNHSCTEVFPCRSLKVVLTQP